MPSCGVRGNMKGKNARESGGCPTGVGTVGGFAAVGVMGLCVGVWHTPVSGSSRCVNGLDYTLNCESLPKNKVQILKRAFEGIADIMEGLKARFALG